MAALLFLLAGLPLLIPASPGARKKDPPMGMRFAGIIQLGEDVRASILGTFGPPDFFANLHSVESSQGTTFQNDTGEVRFFPPRMTLVLRIIGPLTLDGRSIPSAKLDPGLMRGLNLKLQWKRGMKLRPVREFRLLSASQANLIDLENSGRPMDGWTYEMVLQDSQVPVTDHLVLTIFSPENKLLARISAFL